MALRITTGGLVEKKYLEVNNHGVTFYESSLIGNRRKFPFGAIECVLLSPTGILSFQSGNEVFWLKANVKNSKHVEVIKAMVSHVQLAYARAGQQTTG